jgi:hypothetical protein
VHSLSRPSSQYEIISWRELRFLNTTPSTALIIEDDTDWSLNLRHTQIPLLAASVRLLFNSTLSTTEYWARNRDVWVDEGNVEGRNAVGEMVRDIVEMGECPINGLGDERAWKGCEWGECDAQS